MVSHGMAGGTEAVEPSPISALAPARRAMIVLACLVATLSTALIYDVLPPITAEVSRAFGGGAQGDFVASLAGTLPLFGVMAAGLFAGALIERVGLRPVLLGSMALFGVAGSIGAVVTEPLTFLATRILMGIGAGMMTTACTSLVAIFFRGAPRVRMNGLLISVGAFGAIGFVLVAGWAAHFWWRAPFLLHGAVVLVFLLPVLLTGPVPTTEAPAAGAIGNLKRLRPMLPVFVVGFLWFAMMLMAGVQTPFVMALAGVGDHATIAWIYALNAAVVTGSSLLFGHVAGRFDPLACLRWSFVVFAASLCVTGLAQDSWHFALGMVIKGTSMGVGLTALWTWAMRCAPQDMVARSLGAMTTCLYLGGAVSSFLSAPYQLLLGTRGQFLGVAATVVIGVGALWFANQARPARAPLARPDAA